MSYSSRFLPLLIAYGPQILKPFDKTDMEQYRASVVLGDHGFHDSAIVAKDRNGQIVAGIDESP